jgi:ribonucleoside-triphosphate reductase
VLFEFGAYEVMRSFMLYRHTRKLQREHVLGLTEDTTYVDSTQTIEEYISQTDWRINANANTSYSNAGLVNNVAGKIIANYWLDKVYTKEEGFAHRNGDIHIHDLDCLTGYCAGWSLRVLLNDGFNGVRGRVESKPPAHFREALGQMANFLGILQSEWAGAQAFSSFET